SLLETSAGTAAVSGCSFSDVSSAPQPASSSAGRMAPASLGTLDGFSGPFAGACVLIIRQAEYIGPALAPVNEPFGDVARCMVIAEFLCHGEIVARRDRFVEPRALCRRDIALADVEHEVDQGVELVLVERQV